MHRFCNSEHLLYQINSHACKRVINANYTVKSS